MLSKAWKSWFTTIWALLKKYIIPCPFLKGKIGIWSDRHAVYFPAECNRKTVWMFNYILDHSLCQFLWVAFIEAWSRIGILKQNFQKYMMFLLEIIRSFFNKSDICWKTFKWIIKTFLMWKEISIKIVGIKRRHTTSKMFTLNLSSLKETK